MRSWNRGISLGDEKNRILRELTTPFNPNYLLRINISSGRCNTCNNVIGGESLFGYWLKVFIYFDRNTYLFFFFFIIVK